MTSRGFSILSSTEVWSDETSAKRLHHNNSPENTTVGNPKLRFHVSDFACGDFVLGFLLQWYDLRAESKERKYTQSCLDHAVPAKQPKRLAKAFDNLSYNTHFQVWRGVKPIAIEQTSAKPPIQKYLQILGALAASFFNRLCIPAVKENQCVVLRFKI